TIFFSTPYLHDALPISRCFCTFIICSVISPPSKSRFFFNKPLAQKEQPILHPTCVVTHTDNPYGKRINTVSIRLPSFNLNKNLIVQSLDSCLISSSNVCNTKCSSNNAMQDLLTFFISSNELTRFLYSQSHTWRTRNFCSPCSIKKSCNCSYVIP